MPFPTSAKSATIFKGKHVYRFVREFVKHPILYNPNHKLFLDKEERLKHCDVISRKLAIVGLGAYAIREEIKTFRRNYVKRLREYFQKLKDEEPFEAPDWWHIADEFWREHILSTNPEVAGDCSPEVLEREKKKFSSDRHSRPSARYFENRDREPSPFKRDLKRKRGMAGIPNWKPGNSGIPTGKWGGWLDPSDQIIDVDAPDEKARALKAEQEKKREDMSKTRGPPTVLSYDGPFPFLIDSYNFRKHHSPDALDPANSKDHWNRLTIIGGAKIPKEKVLDAIIRKASVVMLIPALYQTDGEDSFFLFREGVVVKRILEKAGLAGGLMILDTSLEKPLEINFLIRYVSVDDEPLNPLFSLNAAINKRLHTENGDTTLDLRNFHNDPEFKNLYVNFKIPKIGAYILNIVQKKIHHRRIHAVLLSHNELDELDIAEALIAKERDVKILDLRHNKLTYSSFERVNLKNWKVHHLLIEGNPICEDYETPGETMHEMRKMFPSMKCLDGVDLEFVLDNRVSFKFYTRNPGYANFVDNFFHHYYTTLENDKDKLVQMYDSKANLSFSVCQNDRVPVPGSFFTPSNRNLISMSNVQKSYDNLFIGKTRIFDALTMMPAMKFDSYSFHIDFPHVLQAGNVLISCTGAFTLPDEPSQQIYTFGRSCILRNDRNVGDWKITNDMWTLMNALPPPNAKCFKLSKRAVKSDFAVMLNPLTKDKDVLVRVVSDLTHMKSAWVEKYLSDSGWDLECTLLSFIDHFKSHLIPFEAFLPFTAPS